MLADDWCAAVRPLAISLASAARAP